MSWFLMVMKLLFPLALHCAWGELAEELDAIAGGPGKMPRILRSL